MNKNNFFKKLEKHIKKKIVKHKEKEEENM